MKPIVLALLLARSVVAATGFARAIFYVAGRDEFAAREVRRYVYLTTGSLADVYDVDQMAPVDWLQRSSSRECIVIASPDSALWHSLNDALPALKIKQPLVIKQDVLKPGEHATRQLVSSTGQAITLLLGADATGRLYAAYTLAETLGVRFGIHGDVLPDPTLALPLAEFAHRPLRIARRTGSASGGKGGVRSPTFDVRGLLPFHDFPEGPDWWDGDMYKHVITQLAKMKMNFIGLHTYPYKPDPVAQGSNEPTVWVGLKDELTADGRIQPAGAYPTSYANTMRGQWGYSPLPTSNYSWGADQLFERDCYAPPPTDESSCPFPTDVASQLAMFERTADMLQSAFRVGDSLGVDGCVGVETPLARPLPRAAVGCRVLELLGCYRDVHHAALPHRVADDDPQVSHEWCAGECALAGLPIAGVEYGVGCRCGPAPPNASLALNMSECATMKCAGDRSEDCGGYDVLLAYRYVCRGPPPPPAKEHTTQDYYEGILTRLKKRLPSLDTFWVWTPESWEWGHMAATDPGFEAAVEGFKAAAAARQAVGFPRRLTTNGWVVGPLPNRSIFDALLPSTFDAIASIDMAVGKAAVDPAYRNVSRHAKWDIPWMEDDPSLTAAQLWVNRTLQHMEIAHEYGCVGLLGLHWRTRTVGPQISAMAQKAWAPSLTSSAFWADWVTSEFGVRGAASRPLARVFESVDSFHMPVVAGWHGGPGKLTPGNCGGASRFAFVDALKEAGAGVVVGAANAARLGYWVALFEYERALADVSCAWQRSNEAMATVAKGISPAERQRLAFGVGLPARIALVSNATVLVGALLRYVSSPGELGTLVDLESRSFGDIFADGSKLAYWLGSPLPPDALPPTRYPGEGRLIVPTVRSTAEAGQPVAWRALRLGAEACDCVDVFVRPLGDKGGAYARHAMAHVGRGVFEIRLSAASVHDGHGDATAGATRAAQGAATPAADNVVELRSAATGTAPAALPSTDFEWYMLASGSGSAPAAGSNGVPSSCSQRALLWSRKAWSGWRYDALAG